MATIKTTAKSALVAAFGLVVTGTKATAQDVEEILWDPWLSFAVSSRDINHRPGNNSLNEDSWSAQLRLAASGHLFKRSDFTWKVDTRTLVSSGNATLFDDDTDTFREPNSDDNYYFHLREAWIRYHGLTSLPGEHLTLGLQRLRNGDGLWWDADIEALVWQGDTTQLDWLLAVGQEFDTYRTNSDLLTRAGDTLRWFGNVKWDWTAYHSIGATFMQSRQYLSDPESAGQDTAIGVNADSFWLGLTVSSGWEHRNPYTSLAYKAEWIMQKGDSLQQSSSTTDIGSTDIDAHAFDVGLRYDFEHLSIGAMYTRGSGGGDANTSSQFSQTGLHSNRTRAFGNRQYVFRFNEAFRADITNLSYAGFFASWSFSSKWEAIMLAGLYNKTDEFTPVYVGGREIAVIDGQSEVGKSLDMNLTFYPDDGWFLNLNVLRLRAGYFNPGEGLLNQNNDYRITLEAQFRY